MNKKFHKQYQVKQQQVYLLLHTQPDWQLTPSVTEFGANLISCYNSWMLLPMTLSHLKRWDENKMKIYLLVYYMDAAH